MGLTNHRVRDAAHQSAPHPPAPSTAHDDEPRIYVLGHPQDLLGPMALGYQFGYLQVLLRDLAPVPLYLLDLLIKDYLCSLTQLLSHFRDPDVVGEVAVVGGMAGSDGHHVKLGAGGGGHVHGGGASQLGFFGAVGGQQDLGREDAHRGTLLSRQLHNEVSVHIVSRKLLSAGGRRRYNSVPKGLQRLIHLSAWKVDSANVALTEF